MNATFFDIGRRVASSRPPAGTSRRRPTAVGAAPAGRRHRAPRTRSTSDAHFYMLTPPGATQTSGAATTTASTTHLAGTLPARVRVAAQRSPIPPVAAQVRGLPLPSTWTTRPNPPIPSSEARQPRGAALGQRRGHRLQRARTPLRRNNPDVRSLVTMSRGAAARRRSRSQAATRMTRTGSARARHPAGAVRPRP